jgi:hypothetical protein
MKITSSHAAITHLRISKLTAENEGNEPNVSTGQGQAIKFSLRFFIRSRPPVRSNVFERRTKKIVEQQSIQKKQRDDCSAALPVS